MVRETLAQNKAVFAVIPNRILRTLLQPLLALLLMAGAAQAEPCLIGEERNWTVAIALDVVSSFDDRADEASVSAEPSSDPDDLGLGYALHSPKVAFVIDQAERIENGQVASPTGPPRHRPCAAPPTGPPLV
jgi:hypothetical protein